MRTIAIIANLAGLTLSQMVTPAAAQPRPYQHRSRCVRHKANKGVVIGAGAVAGHQIVKSNARSSC